MLENAGLMYFVLANLEIRLDCGAINSDIFVKRVYM